MSHLRRSRRAINWQLEACSRQHGNLPAMIQMPMRENQGINRFRALRQPLIDLPRLIPGGLIYPHVEEYPPSVDLNQMTRACDCPVGPAESNSHCGSLVAPRMPCNACNSRRNTWNICDVATTMPLGRPRRAYGLAEKHVQ